MILMDFPSYLEMTFYILLLVEMKGISTVFPTKMILMDFPSYIRNDILYFGIG